MPKNTVSKEKIDLMPTVPGVYFLLNKHGEVFYIGKSTNIKKRVRDHMKAKTFHPVDFRTETAAVEWIETASEVDALLKEAEYIKQHKPKYNILLKDDKKYFYVAIIKQKLPAITITHQPAANSSCKSIGPFTEGRPLKKLLHYLRKTFPYYTTKNHSKLPCSYCHLGLCPGPNPDSKEYRKSVKKIEKILRGNYPSVRKQLIKEMGIAARQLRFEAAQRAKEIKMSLETIFAHKAFLEPSSASCAGSAPSDLAKIVNAKKPIYTIEGYDISNIQGHQPTASMVRFDNGKPNKSLYRKFHIRLPESPNDFAMMREAITRRLTHTEWPYPDLFLVDGGKGQLNAALDAMRAFALAHRTPLKRMPKLSSIAKRQNEFFIPEKYDSLKLDTQAPAAIRNLLMHIRDESHRFAIIYHRKLRRKIFL